MTAPERTLRTGWTTGACATAAAKAAYVGLLTNGEFPDPVQITLPKGQTPSFALTRADLHAGRRATVAVTKDAGDDPDVTHGAIVSVTVCDGDPGSGVVFRAGPGVGTVTKPGLPLPVGEPAINPVPRAMMRDALAEVAATHATVADVIVEIAVENGAEIATHTWNPRLGILGGLSILGTTGVVIPYSCSAWIDSIRRGIDVARAAGHSHVSGCTGTTSEQTVQHLYRLPLDAMLDMGDFAGALLKYLARHPVPRLTIGGGIGKMAKLADGCLDLHSARSTVNLNLLAEFAGTVGADPQLQDRIRTGNSALDALQVCQEAGIALGDVVAHRARDASLAILATHGIAVDVVVIDRGGSVVGRCEPG